MNEFGQIININSEGENRLSRKVRYVVKLEDSFMLKKAIQDSNKFKLMNSKTGHQYLILQYKMTTKQPNKTKQITK